MIIIFLALMFAGLSAAMPKLVETPSQRQAQPVVAAAPSTVAIASVAAAPRGLFVQAGSDAGRTYHPSFGTSDTAGALGFWILISVCAALLAAGFGPLFVQWLRRRGG